MKTFFSLILLLLTSIAGAAQQAPDTSYLSDLKTALRAVWPNNRTINILFHGHSVPAGYGDNHEVHTLDAYPHQVLEQLKAKYLYAPVNVMVTAIGGENAIKGESRFEEDVLQKKPDVILIDYALNDRFAGLEKSRVAWEKMIREALSRNIKVILLTPSPDQRMNIGATGNALEQHANQIRQLAVKYHVGLADPFIVFQAIQTGGGKIEDYMASVNHPNRKGHAIIAAEIMKWFQ